MHVTTSADKCKGIKKNGLHDLVWSYEHETELRSFLDAYNIDIDIGNRKICIEEVAHEISNDIKKSGGVGYKFFDDPYVCEDNRRTSIIDMGISDNNGTFCNVCEIKKNCRNASEVSVIL